MKLTWLLELKRAFDSLMDPVPGPLTTNCTVLWCRSDESEIEPSRVNMLA